MRLRDNDVLRAYSPLHRFSRFTATHLQVGSPSIPGAASHGGS
jgi:hypothetical protein